MNREGLRNIIILCILCVLVGSASAVTTYTAAKTEICYQNDGPRSWDSMHDDTTSAGVSVDAQYGYISRIRDDANSGQYNSFHRGILKFNTSGMTDGYVQEGAKLYVRDWDVGYAHSGFTTNNIAIVALSDTPAWNTGDFDAFDMSKSYTDGVLHEAGRFDYFDIDSVTASGITDWLIKSSISCLVTFVSNVQFGMSKFVIFVSFLQSYVSFTVGRKKQSETVKLYHPDQYPSLPVISAYN